MFIKQAAEKADYRTVYKGENEHDPSDNLKTPKKHEPHYHHHPHSFFYEAGLESRQLYAELSADALDEKVVDLRIEIGFVKHRDRERGQQYAED